MPRPIAPAKIAETEAALGVSFPAVFKLYMSRSNGGAIQLDDEDWFLFPLRDSTNRETIRRSAEDICRETQRAIEAGLGFPADGVAIAHNGAGDLLLLRRQGSRLGDEVWLYRLRGAELALALEDVAELWEHDDS
jgi:hypothetical protein